jgi:hypothetical protein
MFERKDKKETVTFADELRQKVAEAPEKKRREEAEKADQAEKKKAEAVESLYQRCRELARTASEAGEHEAGKGTGFTPGQVSAEQTEILNAVMRKLREADKLEVATDTTVTNHHSDDTGEDFTREHLVIVMTW